MPTQELGPDTETAILVWLAEALEHAHVRGQTKLVGYLQEVADEVVFEVVAARRRSFPFSSRPRSWT